MEKRKRGRLERAGWRVADAREFLGLSEADIALLDLKLALSRDLRARRRKRGLTQAELARQLGSSQSRVAKMETGDPSVSMDLLVRSLLALGARPQDLARTLSTPPR